MRNLQGGHDANGDVVAHTEMDMVHTLKSSMKQGTWCLEMVLQHREQHRKGVSTIATYRGVSEGLCLT
jgi:hypothetical protein